jgi:hypothetical protein
MVKIEHIDTVLTIMFGKDGDGGKFKEVVDKVSSQEEYINQQRGARGVLRWAGTILTAFVAAIIGATARPFFSRLFAIGAVIFHPFS